MHAHLVYGADGNSADIFLAQEAGGRATDTFLAQDADGRAADTFLAQETISQSTAAHLAQDAATSSDSLFALSESSSQSAKISERTTSALPANQTEKSQNQTSNPAQSTATHLAQEKNKQKIWSVNDEVYKDLCTLYVRQGHSLPSSSGPWSTDELEKMLNKICPAPNNPQNQQNSENPQNPQEELDEISQKLYEKIAQTLSKNTRFSTKDGLFFDFNGIFNPEFYLHTNPQNFNKESDWNYDYERRREVLAAENELYISNAIYSYLKFGLTYGSNVFEQYNYDADDKLYAPIFSTNIPYLSGNDFSCLSLNFPQRAFLSTGGNHWSLSFGRDVIRWGSGETGNLFLGGNSLFDTNIRFSVYYNSFKYAFITNFYPHNSIVEQESLGQNANQTGTRFFMAHRVEFRFFADKMTLSLAEGLMYQNKSGFADLTIFNPQTLWHNLYMRGNANSIMSVDFDYTIIKNLSFYSQVLVDEFAFLGEPTSSSESGWRPSKIGGLLGVKYFAPVKRGILKLSAEGVYADPYLYLREKYNSSSGTFGVSFYNDFRDFASGQELYYVRNCLGYKYGGDCITADLKALYDSLENWQSQIEFFYMAHGIIYQDLETDWIYGKQTFAPSTKDITSSSGTTGYVEHSFLMSLSASYDFFDWLKVYGGIDNWIIVNKNNVQSSPVYDFQFYSGISLSF